jgi:hypothetical protein
MKSMILRPWRAIVAMAVFSAAAPAFASHQHHDPTVIVEWNEILQNNIPATAGVFSFRYYAMLHIAMFDAVNSIDCRYTPYRVRVPAHPGAWAEAAAAQAARDVLVQLIPTAASSFDAALDARLATLHPARAALGVAVGKRAAQAVLKWRLNDGFEQPNPPYTPPALPGWWQPTTPGQVAAAVNFGSIKPFALRTPTLYLPAAPPLLNSSQYTEDYNEVKALGDIASITRTEEQRLLARLFAGPPNYGPNPFALWSRVAKNVAASERLSLVQTARLFAHLSAAMNDGLQTAHTSKFVYGLWRPVTAIRRADEDLNDQTIADPAWTPLLGTPPYPSHASNLTCIAASAARIFARTFRSDAVPFTVTWTGLAGNTDVTRSYDTFSQLAQEGGLSRVYGGIHFRFEIDAAYESCTKVGDYVFENKMRRVH